MKERIWLKKIRKNIGLTQEEVALIINRKTNCKISRSMIGHIETGKATPSVEVAKNIETALNFQKYGYKWTDFFEES